MALMWPMSVLTTPLTFLTPQGARTAAVVTADYPPVMFMKRTT
jgi:hypothetical protein